MVLTMFTLISLFFYFISLINLLLYLLYCMFNTYYVLVHFYTPAPRRGRVNVHKNQLSRQTGSRNLTGPKTLPTIWYTYTMLVTKYQISASRFCWFLYTFNIHLYMHIFRCIFLSNYWWQKSDIWSQASYRYPISWEAFMNS
jgi:hypothetical protein